MESEIRQCGRIIFRLPVNKLFQRVKNIKMIYKKIIRKIPNDERLHIKVPDDMINQIKEYFLYNFDLVGKNAKNSNKIWNLCIANGLSSIIPTSSIYEEIDAILYPSNPKFTAKFILFNCGKIDNETANAIIYDNFGKEKMVWWIEKLQISEKMVFEILDNETFHHEINMGIMEIYEAVKHIKDYYSAKTLN